TFIIYKDDKEIGRFVEYPRESVEADLLKIVSGLPYKHSYEE
ncbi:MAG: thioredoxin, partial [Gelidibacter sp.]|nr:thioredoxin [Gelidibacter sp.]